MSRSHTARSALIRLASTLPKGSEERKTILAGLRTAQDKSLMAWSYSRMDGDGGKTTNISAEIKVDRRGNVYMEESFHQEDWSGHPDRAYTKTERLGTIRDPDIETARDIFREKKGWYAKGKRLHSPIRHFQKEMRRLSGRMASMPKGSPERRAILARPNWQSGGSRMDSMTDGFGGEDFFWEGRAAGKPLKMTIEMGHNGMCDLYVHHGGRWLKTKKPYSLRAAKQLAEIVFDALESGEVSNPVFLEHRGQEIFSQSRRASAASMTPIRYQQTPRSDRSALIRLASTLPAGSEERRAILAGLSKVAEAPAPRGVDMAAWQQYSGNVDKSVALLEKAGARLVKYDPNDGQFDYAHFSAGPYKFTLSAQDLVDDSAMASVSRQWRKVMEVVDSFMNVSDPFYDSLGAKTKATFGRSKASNIAYKIIAAMVKSTGKRWN